MNGITTRLHWTDQPYRWHVNDGEVVFAVLDGQVEMRYRQDREEHRTLLDAGVTPGARAEGDTLGLVIREEASDDAAAIDALTRAAFREYPLSQQNEHLIVRGLGPVSVMPAHQRMGIGSALVRSGLRRLRERGAAGCVVLGDPAYYGRFGFAPAPGLIYPGPPPDRFMALALQGVVPIGEVAFHDAFSVRP